MKRGDVSVTQLIMGIIAVVVLVIVVGSLFAFRAGDRISNIIPGLNDSSELEDGLGIIGYNVFENKVYFYDGIDLILIKEGSNYSYNGIIYSEKELSVEFNSYFYGKNEYSGIRQINANTSLIGAGVEFFSNSSTPNLGAYIVDMAYHEILGNGSVWGDIVNRYLVVNGILPQQSKFDDPVYGTYGVFVVDLKDELYILSYNNLKSREYVLMKPGSNRDALVSLASEWRDSILRKPIEIRESEYCVEKNGEYLIVRLAKESDSNEC